MTADIVAFPKALAQRTPAKQGASLPRTWTDQRLPLIDAAMDLLQADEAEFRRRCRTIAEAEGPSMLGQLATQLDKLGAHVGDVVAALATTAARIRKSVALEGSSV